ncbi:M23 family metallopeptidase [Modestobacter marinus]|uniref:M23 family metallopeptidase n=1 Tax=Modestobacter marinus TaxID=477641 RepID=UPI0021BBDD92|nr:M23 family metallopeptidase [Modestobacter marinus]
MDPQHLARIDDDGSMRRWRGGTAGGGSASGSSSSTAPDVAVLALVAPRAEPADVSARRGELVLAGAPAAPSPAIPAPRGGSASDDWPLPAELELLDLAEDWPLAPDAGLLGAGSVDFSGNVNFSGNTVAELGDEPAPSGPVTDPFAPEQVVAALAAGRRGRHRRPPTRTRRPALYLAAALLGAAGVAGTAAAEIGTTETETAAAGKPISVAEELGLLQADPQTLTGDQAAVRLQEMVASRAEREDAQAAAAQVQADADRAAQEAAAEAARPRAAMPVHGARISSGFGYRWGTLHAGIDFAAPLGTPEYAAADGVVVRAGAASGYGLVVYIQHENGDVTVYGHMQEILVEEGQAVKAGEEIATLGNRGQSTGPHLHFEVHVGGIDGEKIDPLPWLRERGIQV